MLRMKRTLKVLSLVTVAAAGVASVLRSRAAAEHRGNGQPSTDHNVCRQLNQAMDRFEERFGT